MTNETLQQKIDANCRRLCEFHFDGYQAELDTWDEINEALQEFREQIKVKLANSSQEVRGSLQMTVGYELGLKDVLALIGEKK